MKHLLSIVLILYLNFTLVFSQSIYQPSEKNLENREWFQDAKFGMFVHWGVYSVLAGGGEVGIAEWVMNKREIPIKQYEKLPSFFNPTAFDPAEWVSLVKKAGMKYITITSKHHDGFAIYDSKISDYDIVDRTPYGKDVLKLLKEECDKQGIKLFFYYSQLDWHHPDYYPRGRTGQEYTGRPEHGNWDAYINYMNSQLTELLTNYGEIGGIWFDGMWDKKDAPWQLEKTYKLIHEHQPGALVGSNHHLDPYPGEDFQMFERDLPGENTMGFNVTKKISTLPLEMCETMNGSWGFNLSDQDYKPTKTLIQTMVKSAGYGANFLLNTGPMPNGKIQPENISTLLEIGKWMEKYGETIYETRKGPIYPGDWGASTITKDGKIYLHVLQVKGENLLLPKIEKEIHSIYYYGSKVEVEYEITNYGIILHIPIHMQDDIDTILVIG